MSTPRTTPAPLAAPKREELAVLAKLDAAAHKLRSQGQLVEALECLERAVVLRQHFFGAESAAVWEACPEAGELANVLANRYLEQGDEERAAALLQKAEVLTARHPALSAVTSNNLACLHRRRGRLHAALVCLQRALEIEGRLAEQGERRLASAETVAQQRAATETETVEGGLGALVPGGGEGGEGGGEGGAGGEGGGAAAAPPLLPRVSPETASLADTHINTCAVLSALTRHVRALEHASTAVQLLRRELGVKGGYRKDQDQDKAGAGPGGGSVVPETPQSEAAGGAGGAGGAEEEGHPPHHFDAHSGVPAPGSLANEASRVQVFGVACHNLAAELEFLQRHEEAHAAALEGLRVCTAQLGSGDEIVGTLRRASAALRRSADAHAAMAGHPVAHAPSKAQRMMMAAGLAGGGGLAAALGDGTAGLAHAHRVRRGFAAPRAGEQLEAGLLGGLSAAQRREVARARTLEAGQPRALRRGAGAAGEGGYGDYGEGEGEGGRSAAADFDFGAEEEQPIFMPDPADAEEDAKGEGEEGEEEEEEEEQVPGLKQYLEAQFELVEARYEMQQRAERARAVAAAARALPGVPAAIALGDGRGGPAAGDNGEEDHSLRGYIPSPLFWRTLLLLPALGVDEHAVHALRPGLETDAAHDGVRWRDFAERCAELLCGHRGGYFGGADGHGLGTGHPGFCETAARAAARRGGLSDGATAAGGGGAGGGGAHPHPIPGGVYRGDWWEFGVDWPSPGGGSGGGSTVANDGGDNDPPPRPPVVFVSRLTGEAHWHDPLEVHTAPPLVTDYLTSAFRRADVDGRGALRAQAFWEMLVGLEGLKLNAEQMAQLHAHVPSADSRGDISWTGFVLGAPAALEAACAAELLDEMPLPAQAPARDAALASKRYWCRIPPEYDDAYVEEGAVVGSGGGQGQAGEQAAQERELVRAEFWYNKATGVAQWRPPKVCW